MSDTGTPSIWHHIYRVNAIFFQLFYEKYSRIRPPMQTAAARQNAFKSGAHKFFSQGAILDSTLVAIPRTLVVKHLRNIRWQWEFAEMVWKSITPPLGRDYQREKIHFDAISSPICLSKWQDALATIILQNILPCLYKSHEKCLLLPGLSMPFV